RDADSAFHHDHLGLLFDDFFRHPRSIDIAGHPTIISADVATNGPPKGLQRLAERCSVPLSFRVVRTPHPYCDLPHARRLLRPRRERPRGCRAAEQRQEVAPFHAELGQDVASTFRGSYGRIAHLNGQETGALRDFNPADDRSGSFASQAAWTPVCALPLHPESDTWPGARVAYGRQRQKIGIGLLALILSEQPRSKPDETVEDPSSQPGQGRTSMESISTDRRDFMKAAGVLGMTVAASSLGMRGASAQQVPYSSGTEAPKLKAPANACDCHMHIYDAKYPIAPSATLKPPDALVADYKLRQKCSGTRQIVIVTPPTYGTDNRVPLDAIAQIGATARGVAAVDPSVAAADLKRMNDLGIRGTRFTLVQGGATTVEMIEP